MPSIVELKPHANLVITPSHKPPPKLRKKMKTPKIAIKNENPLLQDSLLFKKRLDNTEEKSIIADKVVPPL